MHLKTGDVETDPAATVTEIASPNPDGAGHLLLHFPRHPTAAMVSELKENGVQVIGDVPDNGLLVVVAQPTDVAALGVNYAAPISPRNKISPLITPTIKRLPGKRAIRARSAPSPAYFIVEFHPDTDMNRARGTLLNLGLVPLNNPDLNPSHLMFQVEPNRTAAALSALSLLDEVAYVFPASRELMLSIPARYYAGALTNNGPAGQSIPVYGSGWDGPGLGTATMSYVFSRMTAQLGSAAAQAEIVRAMAEWSKVAAISWRPGASPFASGTVNVVFAAYDHSDGYPFDGPGGVVAHTFYPAPPNPEPIAGDMHFDDSESWHIGVNTDVFSVALHELGHALGLGHSDDPTAVMYPYYKMVTTLAAPDVAAILTLYAAKTSPPAPGPTPPLTLTVNPAPSTTTASSVNLSGSAAGWTGVIAVAWSSTGGASGTATGLASAWSIVNIPLAIGVNTITVTASTLASRISKSVTITRQSVTTGSGGGSGGGSPDTTAPALTITTPSTGTMSTTAASVIITGTASDNVGVRLVSWATNFGTAGVATGTTVWSAAIPLLIGNNSVTVRAVDAAGNAGWRSLVIARH